MAITTASPLPVGTVGAEYQFALTATGGTTACIWSVIGGSLPSGVSLSSTGFYDVVMTNELGSVTSAPVRPTLSSRKSSKPSSLSAR